MYSSTVEGEEEDDFVDSLSNRGRQFGKGFIKYLGREYL